MMTINIDFVLLCSLFKRKSSVLTLKKSIDNVRVLTLSLIFHTFGNQLGGISLLINRNYFA